MNGGTGAVDRTTRLIPELHGREPSSGAGLAHPSHWERTKCR